MTNKFIGLQAQLLQEETWRDCVRRNAAEYGLVDECLAIFDREVALGMDEHRAAWNSMYEWDLGLKVVEIYE